MSWRDQLQHLRQSAPADITAFLRSESNANTDDLDLHFARARHAQAHLNYVEAIGAFLPVSMASGHLQAASCLHLGECFEQLADKAGARLAYEKAARIEPASHWPVANLSRLVHQDEGAEPAMATLRAALPNLLPDGKAAIIRQLADFSAVRKYNAERQNPAWRAARDIALPALHDAVMIMLVKDEADIIGQSLRHHYALGFRRFCILDNASTDATAAVIAGFRAETPQALVLVVQDPITGYYQSAKMAAAERLCEAFMSIDGPPISWFFFVDADEFITFAGSGGVDATGLNAALADTEKTLLIMHWVHCAPNAIYRTLPEGADPFDYHKIICPALRPAVPKIAYRAGNGLKLTMGNHFVSEFDQSVERVIIGAEYGLYMFHFSLRSLAHVYRKVINGGKAYQAATGLDEHGDHWRKRYEIFQKQGDQMIIQILANHIREMSQPA
jgi:hypothetical protein